MKPLRRKSPFPYVKPVRRKGKLYWYFSRTGQALVRLPDAWGSVEFIEACRAAIAGETAPKLEIGDERARAGSVSAAIITYLNSIDFGNLAPGTQRARRAILDRFRERFGHLPIEGLTGQRIEAILAEKAATPGAARHLFKALRGVTKVAMRARLIDADPTMGVCKPKMPDTGGYKAWSDEHIAKFEDTYPIGSRARLAEALMLYTGQRRGDIIRMGRQHIRGNFIEVRQQKTGTVLQIPLHPELLKILAAHPADNMTFLTTRTGQPFAAAGFTHWFRLKCREAGLPGLSPHGLRKAMCRRLAEAGCRANEIAAISGHVSLAEVQRYTRDADQRRTAMAAMATIEQKVSWDWKTEKIDWKTIPQVIENKKEQK
jgi:integrase